VRASARCGVTSRSSAEPQIREFEATISLPTDGQADDLTSFLDRRLLVSQWPVLRRMVGRIVRDVWESAFPELGEGHQPTS
jgi:hypothetical protein